MADILPLVCDMGSGELKVGRATSPVPEFVLPNTVGRPILRSDESFSRQKLKDVMIADETTSVRQYLELVLPIEGGVVRNWPDEELVLNYVWNEKMKIRPQDHTILVTEPALTPVDSRKAVIEAFFEKFGFEGLSLTPQALLVLYAQGLVTGLVVESGDGVTHIMPVFENYLLPHLVRRHPVSGRDVTERMVQLLTLRGYTFHKTSDFDIVRQIKEKLCFVSADIAKDRKIAVETTSYVVPYTLPDSRVIKVSGERFEAPECIFQPHQIGLEGAGLSETVYRTIMEADINLRKKFFESIVVSGGNTMFPGLSTRLINDIKRLVGENILRGNKEQLAAYKINVDDPPTRRFLVYLGATVLASLGRGKDNAWCWKKEYKEIGVDGVAKRFGALSGT